MSTYFPEEVFRNIASFLVDPYKADREKHASVWQTIRVRRNRWTSITETFTNWDFQEDVVTEDVYHVCTTYQKGEHLSHSQFLRQSIRTEFRADENNQFDNLRETITRETEEGRGESYETYHNYLSHEYDACYESDFFSDSESDSESE